ncbi:MAG: mannonate dehydratase [Anaerolineae bacterium]|nr:mannonate dehydratase [Anaerolineae bacterium]
MKIGLRSHNGAEDRLRYAQQIGADGASIWGWAVPEYNQRGYLNADDVRMMRQRFDRYDLELTGIGLGGAVLKNQLNGSADRDEDIDKVSKTIRAIGEAYADHPEIAPVVIIDQRLTYWVNDGRYPHSKPGYSDQPIGRGGTLLLDFDYRAEEVTDAPAGVVPYEEAWSRIAYLYDHIVPVAEESRVRLATHPDDPPLQQYWGVEQVLTGFEGLRKLVETYESPYNGLLFCIGTMQEAGEDVPELIRYFGERQKIFYVHFRNVTGVVPQYREVFASDGDGNMIENFRALKQIGFQGYVVPDHHPGIQGDTDWQERSRAWHVGYLKGLIQTLGA